MSIHVPLHRVCGLHTAPGPAYSCKSESARIFLSRETAASSLTVLRLRDNRVDTPTSRSRRRRCTSDRVGSTIWPAVSPQLHLARRVTQCPVQAFEDRCLTRHVVREWRPCTRDNIVRVHQGSASPGAFPHVWLRRYPARLPAGDRIHAIVDGGRSSPQPLRSHLYNANSLRLSKSPQRRLDPRIVSRPVARPAAEPAFIKRSAAQSHFPRRGSAPAIPKGGRSGPELK